MNLHEIATQFFADTQQSLFLPFAPEAILCLAIMGMLLVRVLPFGQYVPGFLLALIGSGLALYSSVPWAHLGKETLVERRELFTGMLVYDELTVFMRAFLLTFAVLFVVLTRLTRNPDRDDAIDFYCLVLGGTLGMCLMASANHLLMVFLAIEMASVPSYVLAGQMKFRRESSEAALKYSIYGAGTAGIMLYGISLIAGVLHTAHLPTVAIQLYELYPSLPGEQVMVLALGGLMVMVGLAFKLSAVPFHFWCPDVFEGASAEVRAFLSVASKAAALALLVRVALGTSVLPDAADQSSMGDQAASTAVASTVFIAQAETDEDGEELAADESNQQATLVSSDGPLTPVRSYIVLLVGILAAVTCTFGNLAAYGQTNIKRLMAYSTIAHAGYMMMAVPPAVAVATVQPAAARAAISALALYVAIYLLMNLAAFAIIAFYRNALGTEEIADYGGLVRRSPVIVVMFAIVLFSLVGLPPLAGFFGKFAIFAALTQSWRITDSGFLLALLVIGGINTAISLFYYLRIVKVMTIDDESDTVRAAIGSPVSLMAGTYVAVLTIPIVTLIVYLDALNNWTLAAARQLF